MQSVLTRNSENVHLKETKLVDILDPFSIEYDGGMKILETKDTKHSILQVFEDPTEKHYRKSLLSCYDMGGHTEYYNSQKVR